MIDLTDNEEVYTDHDQILYECVRVKTVTYICRPVSGSYTLYFYKSFSHSECP